MRITICNVVGLNLTSKYLIGSVAPEANFGLSTCGSDP